MGMTQIRVVVLIGMGLYVRWWVISTDLSKIGHA
jgi:hypothetical protein